jgi:hydroxymethylpyrimidine/phosphomethylpyrimidine kinase
VRNPRQTVAKAKIRARPTLPAALTIAGSDSGGGAGIQADLKTFASLGVHGASAITCITAQNPREVRSVQACHPPILRDQIEAVLDELRPSAVKTGMLYSEPIIRVVADIFAARKSAPLVVDPVMVSTSGVRLLKPGAVRALKRDLLPLAVLVTPNLDETQILTGRALHSPEDLRVAARDLHEQFGCAALVKGGHLRGLREAVDIFWDGHEELLLSAPFRRGVSTHGTGCTYSAAIAGYLARGLPLSRAVREAKDYITAAIAMHCRTAGHTLLNSFWASDPRR